MFSQLINSFKSCFTFLHFFFASEFTIYSKQRNWRKFFVYSLAKVTFFDQTYIRILNVIYRHTLRIFANNCGIDSIVLVHLINLPYQFHCFNVGLINYFNRNTIFLSQSCLIYIYISSSQFLILLYPYTCFTNLSRLYRTIIMSQFLSVM